MARRSGWRVCPPTTPDPRAPTPTRAPHVVHPGRTSSRQGFTLVELAMAFAILAVLAAISIPLYASYVDRARQKDAILDIRALQGAIERDRHAFGRISDGIAHLVDVNLVDPWGNPYQYLNLQSGDPGVPGRRRRDRNLNPINSDYDLYSMGEDAASMPPLTHTLSQDDIVRANDGDFVGLGRDY